VKNGVSEGNKMFACRNYIKLAKITKKLAKRTINQSRVTKILAHCFEAYMFKLFV